MVNLNGNIISNDKADVSLNNRAFNYGDSLFETIKIFNDKILFWEDHYFRLMASMRILRMEIPANFTPEHLENEIITTYRTSKNSGSCRIKLTVFRKDGGLYLPKTNDVSYLITFSNLENDYYQLNQDSYLVELFKDYFVSPGLLSTLKTNNRIVNVVGSIFAEENDFQNCLILNTNKHVIEALNANIFLIVGNHIKTPPLTDGCINGIIRKQLINIIGHLPEFTLEEGSISPFELQKADELFLTNIVFGIQPITQYRKKKFNKVVTQNLLAKLNMKLRN